MLRRRDRVDWHRTTVAHVFDHASDVQLLRLREMTIRVQHAFQRSGQSLLEAFNAYDVDGDGWLSEREL